VRYSSIIAALVVVPSGNATATDYIRETINLIVMSPVFAVRTIPQAGGLEMD
jgi:hypothetical protein